MQDRQPTQAYDPTFYINASAICLVGSIVLTLMYAKKDFIYNAGNHAALRLDYYFSGLKDRLFKTAKPTLEQVPPTAVAYKQINASLALNDEKRDAIAATEMTSTSQSEPVHSTATIQPTALATPAEDNKDDDGYVHVSKEGEMPDEPVEQLTTRQRRLSR